MVNKKIIVQAIIEKIENDFDNAEIQTSVVEGYETPDKILSKGKEEKSYTPDVILRNNDTTEIYEVELDDHYEIEKWRLFSLFSGNQKGNFNIVTPEDQVRHMRELLDENQIEAKIIYFS